MRFARFYPLCLFPFLASQLISCTSASEETAAAHCKNGIEVINDDGEEKTLHADAYCSLVHGGEGLSKCDACVDDNDGCVAPEDFNPDDKDECVPEDASAHSPSGSETEDMENQSAEDSDNPDTEDGDSKSSDDSQGEGDEEKSTGGGGSGEEDKDSGDTSAEGEGGNETGDDGSQGTSDEGNPDGEDGAEDECVDDDDCPKPEDPCKEAYCDDAKECAQRTVDNNTPISEWSEWEECVFEDECIETGEKLRTQEVCNNGKPETVEEKGDCERDTDGKTLSEGEWGDCKAEGTGSDDCVEKHYRTDEVCEDGKPADAEVSDTCTAEGLAACGVCGNGILEDAKKEECEIGDDFCGDCTNVIYVDVNVSGGSRDGSSWNNAMKDLQAAMDKAWDDYARRGLRIDVWVANGTYKRIGGASRAGFVVPAGIQVFGGFNGSEFFRKDRETDPEKIKTILSGDLNGNDEAGNSATMVENSYHVVDMSDATDSRLDSFVIQGGNANGSSSSSTNFGGGLVASKYEPALPYLPGDAVSILHSGSGHNEGNPVRPLGSSGTLALGNLRIANNTAVGAGGGMAIVHLGRKIWLDGNIIIESNTCPSSNGTGGGFVVVGQEDNPADTQLAGYMTIRKNSSGDIAGGMWVGEGVFNMRRSSRLWIEENEANRQGGGLFISDNGEVRATENIALMYVLNNRAIPWSGSHDGNGGGVYINPTYGTGSFARLIAEGGGKIEISNNSASFAGGGIYNNTNGEIREESGGFIFGEGNTSDNSWTSGGGVYSYSGGIIVGDITDVKGTPGNVYEGGA